MAITSKCKAGVRSQFLRGTIVYMTHMVHIKTFIFDHFYGIIVIPIKHGPPQLSWYAKRVALPDSLVYGEQQTVRVEFCERHKGLPKAVFHCRIKNRIDIFESSTAPVLRSDETEASSVTDTHISCPHSTSCRVSDVDLPIYLDFL